MPPEAQQRWHAALVAYRELYPERNLATLFRSDAAQATGRALDGDDVSRVDPKLRAILQTVAPVYREHIWPSDQKADAGFIEALQPLLAKHGATVAKNMAAALGGPPPQGDMRADVTAFAGPVGAYTILRPVLIAISSTDERHRDRERWSRYSTKQGTRSSFRWPASCAQRWRKRASRATTTCGMRCSSSPLVKS